jgi:hypothetical protein
MSLGPGFGLGENSKGRIKPSPSESNRIKPIFAGLVEDKLRGEPKGRKGSACIACGDAMLSSSRIAAGRFAMVPRALPRRGFRCLFSYASFGFWIELNSACFFVCESGPCRNGFACKAQNGKNLRR